VENSFDWLSYISLADILAKEDSEECYRSATSRAYYGVLGTLTEALEKLNVTFPQVNIHHELVFWFRHQQDAGF